MAKQIKTRLLLKYDTYQNWTNEEVAGQGANLVLLKGEIGLCAIETGVTTAPTVLFKVGDGTTPFKELKWASALAADVYAWAKQAELPVERADAEGVDAGNVISSIRFEDGKIKYTTTTVATSASVEDLTTRVKAIEDAKFGEAIADINAALELKANANDVYTKTEVDTKVQEAIATAAGDATSKADTALQSAKGYTDTLANGQVKTNKENIATLTTKVETLETTGGQANVIEGVQVNGADLPISNKKVNIDLANATVANAGDADKLGGVAATDYATKTVAQGYADAKDTAIAAAKKAGTDAQAYAEGVAGRVATIESDYLKAADKTALQEQITTNANAITTLTDGLDPDKIDGVKDLVDYVNDHGTEVTGMKEDIAANSAAIALAETKEDANQKLADAKAYTDEQVEAAKVDAANGDAVVLAEAQAYAKEYADDNFLLKTEYKEYDDTALSDKVTALETAVGNENSGLVKDVADLEAEVAKKLDANGWSTADNKLSKGNVSLGDNGILYYVNDSKTAYASLSEEGIGIASLDEKEGYTYVGDGFTYVNFANAEVVVNTVTLPVTEKSGTLALTSDIDAAVADLAVADNVYTKTEIDAKLENIDLSAYVAKTEAPGYGDILTKTEAATTYRAKADKITSDDLSDEIWIFNCGSATVNITG